MEDDEELSTLARLRRAVDPLSTYRDIYDLYKATGEMPQPEPRPITKDTILTASNISDDPEVLEARRRIAEGAASGLVDSVSSGVGPVAGITKKTEGGFLHLIEPGENSIAKIRNAAKKELALDSLSAKKIPTERFSVRPSDNGYGVFDNLKQEMTIYNADKNYAKDLAHKWNNTDSRSASYLNEGISTIHPISESDIIPEDDLLLRYPTNKDRNLRLSRIDEILSDLRPSESNYDLAFYQDLLQEKRQLQNISPEKFDVFPEKQSAHSTPIDQKNFKPAADIMLRIYENPSAVLTKKEFSVLSKRVDEINSQFDLLDDKFHGNQIDALNLELDGIIQTMEDSLKRARIKKSGLKVVK